MPDTPITANKRRQFIWIVFITILFAIAYNPAYSEQAPSQKRLDTIKDDLEKKKRAREQTEKSMEEAQESLNKTQKTVIQKAQKVQEAEKELKSLETQISHLERKEKALKTQLNHGRESISKLIMAIQRLERTPPELSLIRPGKLLETAQTSLLIRRLVESLNAESAELRARLNDLSETRANLNAKKTEAENKVSALQSEYNAINALMAQRKAHFEKISSAYSLQKQDIEALSREAEDVSALLSSIKKREDDLNARSAKVRPNERTRSLRDSADGNARLPLLGAITVHYNSKDRFGSPSKGIRIEGRSAALITAPMSGIVRFAGFFKNYGNMVIIEHQGGFHSLIAGLDNINAVVGQDISVGEPIGNLESGQNGQNPELYFELRKHGVAVDPAIKFTNMG